MSQLKLGFLWALSFIPVPLFLALYEKEKTKQAETETLETKNIEHMEKIEKYRQIILSAEEQLQAIDKRRVGLLQNGSQKTTACLAAIKKAFHEELRPNASADDKAKNIEKVDYTAEERLMMRIVIPQLCSAARDMANVEKPHRLSEYSLFRQHQQNSERPSYELITPIRTSLTACAG